MPKSSRVRRAGSTRSVTAFAAVLLLSCSGWLAGCKSTPDAKYDETRNWSAERLYNEAKEELVGGNYKKAIDYYEKLGARFPYGRYSQQAQLELGYAYFKNRDPAQALAAADRFIKLYPDHPNVDYAYYLKGLVNFNEDLGLFGSIANQDPSERDPKAMRESFDAFREMVIRFPDSRYTPDAYTRMRYLVNSMANFEASVAYYYMRRKAYVAAISRAQGVLLDYPQSPAVERALAIMIKSYDAIGMAELRDDTDRLLKLNFPNTKYQVAGDYKRRWYQIW
jgi:outer membrane protein assembly factor BamD